MPRASATFRAALAAAGILVPLPAAAQGGACPPPAPVLSGPATASLFESYSISWTDVLVPRGSGPSDVFVVERSEDPRFVEGVESYETVKTTGYFRAPLGAPRTIHHRVAVRSSCGGGASVRAESRVLSISFLAICPAPIALSAPAVSPSSPPAYSTYVVSWDTLGAGEPGPGGGAQGLRFRLRRTSANEVRETLVDGGSTAFTDGPGEFLYQVRTENLCGAVGEWSKAARVLVGERKVSALALVAGPRPTLMAASAAGVGTLRASVRNVGYEPLDVRVEPSDGALAVSPSSFRLDFGESRDVSVRVLRVPEPGAPSENEKIAYNNH